MVRTIWVGPRNEPRSRLYNYPNQHERRQDLAGSADCDASRREHGRILSAERTARRRLHRDCLPCESRAGPPPVSYGSRPLEAGEPEFLTCKTWFVKFASSIVREETHDRYKSHNRHYPDRREHKVGSIPIRAGRQAGSFHAVDIGQTPKGWQ